MKAARTMAGKDQRVLAVAARTQRIACVVLDDGFPVMWDAAGKSIDTVADAVQKLRAWIAEYRPDVLVSENPDTAAKKGKAQIAILRAFAETGEDLRIRALVVRRRRRFKNVYDEAAAFGAQFPDLAGLVPKKPRLWESEGHTVVCFEALALARDAGLLQQS